LNGVREGAKFPIYGWWALKDDFKEDAMCDYSLEMYGSRPARESEKYVTTRFPSGTIGLASPGHLSTPVCVQCDTQLLIEDIPARVQKKFGIGDKARAIFTRLDTGSYRDGLKFGEAQEISLQELEPGIAVSVVALLEKTPMPIYSEAMV
jgi:hypothetical protein